MKTDPKEWNVGRRTFIAGSAALLASHAAGAQAKERTSAPIINALGGLEDPNNPEMSSSGLPDATRPKVNARSIQDAIASGLTAVNVTLGYVAGPQDPYEYTLNSIKSWDQVLSENTKTLIKVGSVADIHRAKKERKIGVIYGFQNATQVGDKPERIDTFHELGVRVIQLTYNPANQLGDGSMAPENRGLTEFGRQVVARLNANRIMVDLSHSGQQICLDAISASEAPISINHTGCRALTDLPRNKTDAELRGVADKGGFIGIYFMPYLNLSGHVHAEDVVAHIEYAVNICGEDHVGIGTDSGVTSIDDLEAYKARLAVEIAGRAKAGIGAKGERADTLPFAIDLRGVNQFHKLSKLLKARGYSSHRVDKILGTNYVDFAQRVWGA